MTGDAIGRLLDAGLIAILRARSSRHLRAVADALIDAGVSALEITLTTPDAMRVLAELSRAVDPSVIVGAGTVLTTEQAEASIEAGARFLVSPTTSSEVALAARTAGVGYLPGTFTPTEVHTAARGGARAVKLFPAASVGPRFVRELHGPFPEIAVVPSGGIDIDDVPEWMSAGAAAVGLGGALVGTAASDGPDADLGRRAHRALAAVARARTRA